MHDASYVIFLRAPGVGKTDLSVALAEAAIQAGLGAYFITAHDLVSDLGRAYREGRLDRRMRIDLAPKVLINATPPGLLCAPSERPQKGNKIRYLLLRQAKLQVTIVVSDDVPQRPKTAVVIKPSLLAGGDSPERCCSVAPVR